MDTSNWRHTEVGHSSMESSDWRAQLQPDSRERMVNRIMDAMKSHTQVSGNEGLQELEKIAESFEEKVYIAATSQSDYMRKICFKILTIETTSQNPIPDVNTVNPSDTALTCNYADNTTIGNSSTENDWRAQLPADGRQRIVNKIMDTVKRCIPFSGPEGLQELENKAVRFEDTVYNVATSQSDYLRKISLKMLMMETKTSCQTLCNSTLGLIV